MSINGLNRNNSLDRIVGNFTTVYLHLELILELLVMETYLVYKTVGSHDLTVSSTQGWTQRSKVITTTPGGSAPAIPGTNVHAFVLGGGGGGWYSSAAGAGGAVEHPTYDISPYGSSAIPIVVGDGGYSVQLHFQEFLFLHQDPIPFMEEQKLLKMLVQNPPSPTTIGIAEHWEMCHM